MYQNFVIIHSYSNDVTVTIRSQQHPCMGMMGGPKLFTWPHADLWEEQKIKNFDFVLILVRIRPI